MRAFSSGSHDRPTIGQDHGVMSRIVKLLLVLALALPVGAYAVGSLVASAADEPAQREPIVLREPPARTGSPSPSATPDDRGGRGDDGDEGARDDDADDDADDDGDDDGPEAVDPSYADLDDDAEDALEDALEDAADEAEDRRDDRRDAAEDARDDRDDRDGDDD
jgi:hypothetical protein